MAENEQPAGWKFNPQNEAPQQGPDNSSSGKEAKKEEQITWTASEFIDNQKDAKWYGAFSLGGIACVGVVYFATKDLISAITISIVVILMFILAKRKPRQLSYEVNQQGIQIGQRLYPYNLFKSFGLAQDGAITYINLMPLKRFMPDIPVYFPPDQAAAIVNTIKDHLPNDQRPEKYADRLFKKIRF